MSYAYLIVCRVACRNKRCETPLEIISSELIASEVIPSAVVKTILYPGALAKSLIAGSHLPNYDQLFDDMNRASFSSDIHHLEVALLLPFPPINMLITSLFIYTICCFSGVCWELFMSTWSFTQPLQTHQNKLYWHAFDLLGSYQRHSSIRLTSLLD